MFFVFYFINDILINNYKYLYIYVMYMWINNILMYISVENYNSIFIL